MNRILLPALVGLFLPLSAFAVDRPNILWVTCEDISPNLGCYGDDYAVTPNIDKLATEGVRYTHAFAPIGVCAPARSCLITGMYPPSLGTQHMRCQGNLPPRVRCFPEYLRKAGYYCTNNRKEDYNFKKPPGSWDQSNNKAHWRGRKDGQPFFAVFNYTSCHESQIRLSEKAYQNRVKDFTEAELHDPKAAPIPPYHPDYPAVHRDWARYADMITFMDKQVGNILKELEEDGLAEDTIVFFYSDHGAGMPRSKRWLYDSSTRVPLIIRFPEKWAKYAPGRPGSTTDRLVNFIDFGPTVLSLTGVKIPDHMQGEAFLGDQATEPRQYVYGFRDRMDERYDMIRSVRDKRYKYIRNYRPHLPWFHHQFISYMYQMPTMKVWQRLADEGKLSGPPAVFMAMQKPTEELYDCQADPWEVNNLADSPEHQDILSRLRKEHRRWMLESKDLGLMPEADLRSRFGNTPQYTAVREHPDQYPMERIAAAADLANARDPANFEKLVELLKDDDPAVRFWAATGLGALGEKAPGKPKYLSLMLTSDKSPLVRVATADALCRLGRSDEAVPALIKAMSEKNDWVRLEAINVLDHLDEKAAPAKGVIEDALKDSQSYVVRVATHALEAFNE